MHSKLAQVPSRIHPFIAHHKVSKASVTSDHHRRPHIRSKIGRIVHQDWLEHVLRDRKPGRRPSIPLLPIPTFQSQPSDNGATPSFSRITLAGSGRGYPQAFTTIPKTSVTTRNARKFFISLSQPSGTYFWIPTSGSTLSRPCHSKPSRPSSQFVEL